MKSSFLFLILVTIGNTAAFSQCCAGGSGSPIAGGTSQGVLQEFQFELNTNFQLIHSDQFFTKDAPASNKYFDHFESVYQYFRAAYGLTNQFTFSLEAGYYFYKREVGLNNDPSRTYASKGIGDLIIFPRYTVFKSSSVKHDDEVTLGIGYKVPLGSYNDSTGQVEPFSGQTFYVTNPQAVQVSSGSQDIIFYSFLYRGFFKHDFRIFSSMLYIKKSWNPLGEKMGDFASLGVFAGKTFRKKYGLTLQIRGEWMNKMKLNPDILLHAYPNYDPEATGYKKIFFTPQVSYSRRNLSFYLLADLPLYQYVEKTQVGSSFQATTGLSYRINPRTVLPGKLQP